MKYRRRRKYGLSEVETKGNMVKSDHGYRNKYHGCEEKNKKKKKKKWELGF
jgi:hypothetical protein